MQTLPRGAKLLFGAGESGFSIVMTTIDVFFLYFLLTVAKLPPVSAAAAIFIGKTWDWINDPLMGLLTDRTRSRWGKRRPYLLFGAIPFGCAFVLLWWVPPLTTSLLTAYYAFAYFLYDTSLTIVTVPYYALVPDLAGSYDERTSINAYRMGFSIAAGLLAFVAPEIAALPIFPSERAGWLGMGALFAIVSLVPLWGAFHASRWGSVDTRAERAGRGQGIFSEASAWLSGHRGIAIAAAAYFIGWIALFGVLPRAWPGLGVQTAWTDFILYAGFLAPMGIIVTRSFSKNAPFLISMAIFLLTWTTVAMMQSVLPFYITYWLKGEENLTLIMAAVFASALLWLPFWSWYSRRHGKKLAYVVGMVSLAVILMAISALPRDTSLGLVMGLAVLAGVGVSAAHVIPNALIPDAIEWEELRTGKRREGFFYSVVGLLNKVATSVAVPWVALMLGVSGFDESRGVDQVPGAFLTLRLLVGMVPGLLMGVGIVCAALYPLSRQRHERICRLLELKKARSAAPGAIR